MQTKMHFSAVKARSVFSEQIKIDKNMYMSAVLSASFLLVFAGLAIFPVTSSLSETYAASTISETTLEMTTEDIDFAFSVDNANGTFSASEPSTFSVVTNNYTGYTLSIRAAEDDADNSKLINGESVFNSISSAGASSTFNNGNWGYLPSKLNSEVNTDYQPAPTHEGTTLDTTNQANDEANIYSITLGAKANYEQVAGKYSNTFVIAAVANPVGYSITYNKNTEDPVTNMPPVQNGNASEYDIIISPIIPERDSYSFTGWCDGVVSSLDNIDSCVGDVYEPSDSYETDQTTQNNAILYAMWSIDEPDDVCNPSATDIEEAVCMQDMNSDIIESMTEEQQYQLMDKRDEKMYWISKLADGNVWMTQNLDFDIVAGESLSSLDTNLTVANYDPDEDGEYILYSEDDGYSTENGVIYWTPSISTASSNNAGTGFGDSTDTGDWYYTDQIVPSAQHNYLNNGGGTYFSEDQFVNNGAHGHVGNYYSFGAATARTEQFDTFCSTDDYGYNDCGQLMNSICPAGWKLPDAMSKDSAGNYKNNIDYLSQTDYYGLIYHYNDSGFFGGQGLDGAPFFATRAGTFSGGTLKNAGYDGYYWSSTIGSDGLSPHDYEPGRELMIRSSAIDPLNAYDGNRQRSVRCLAAAATPSDEYDLTRIWMSLNNADYYDYNYGGLVIDSGTDSNINPDYENRPTDYYGHVLNTLQLMRRNGSVKLAAASKIYSSYHLTEINGDYYWLESASYEDEDYSVYSIFRGWNTEPDGSGTFVEDGSIFTSDESQVILYAQWEPLRVVYDNNGGEGELSSTGYSESDSYVYLENISYDDPAMTKTGYHFVGWNTEPDGSGVAASCLFDDYSSDCRLELDGLIGEITLYAQWSDQVTIHFEAGSGGVGTMADQVVTQGVPTALKANEFSNNSGEPLFYYWNNYGGGDICSSDSCEDGETITVPSDNTYPYVTLEANWTSSFTIHFDGNGADSGDMYDYYCNVGYECTIGENEYVKSGYIFNGWNTQADGSGVGYGSSVTGPVNKKEITLYAQWRLDGGDFIGTDTHTANVGFVEAYTAAYVANDKSIYVKDNSTNTYHVKGENEDITGKDTRFAMQDINLEYTDSGSETTVCDAVTIEDDSIQVLDIRDNNLYWIAKTKDGRCWMTQNLDFDLSTATTLTSNDTDLTDASLSGYYNDGYSVNNGVISWTPNKSTSVALNASSIPNDDDYNAPRSTDIGDWYYTDTFASSTQANYLDGGAGTFFSQNPFNGNGEHGHVGNYYNWPAAIATNGYSNNDDPTKDYHLDNDVLGPWAFEGLAPITRTFDNSICPAGWKLPVTNETETYDYSGVYKTQPEYLQYMPLYQLNYYYNKGYLYNSVGLESAPLYFTRSGTIRRGGLGNAGYDGYYWSSQASQRNFLDSSDMAAYNLIVRSNALDVGNLINVNRQRSVRCVARSSSYRDPENSRPEILDLNGYQVVVKTNEPINIVPISSAIKTIGCSLPGDSTQQNCVDHFAHWNTEPDDSGTSYADEAQITISEYTYLYAIYDE